MSVKKQRVIFQCTFLTSDTKLYRSRTTKIKPLNDNLSQRKYIVFAWKDHTMKIG